MPRPSTLDTRNLTRQKTPAFPYQDALEAVLPGWDLSLAFVGSQRARMMNRSLRKKEYVPNVLSYETGKKSGEIVICLQEAKKQAPAYGLPYPGFVGFLFIHGCFHLKGSRHGTTMERQERALLARLAPTSKKRPNGSTNRNRH